MTRITMLGAVVAVARSSVAGVEMASSSGDGIGLWLCVWKKRALAAARLAAVGVGCGAAHNIKSDASVRLKYGFASKNRIAFPKTAPFRPTATPFPVSRRHLISRSPLDNQGHPFFSVVVLGRIRWP